ncbi:MAG: ABC transporter ATP-binding protein [Acidimicrobiaceae bacterium]|nr:ABC transporter ATP-binding protein [Acidimicrobiaceae bacterium]
MWAAGGVAPEDRLDRGQTGTVIIRVLRMAKPFIRTAYIALGCVVVTTAATLAAPVLVRHGIDSGIRVNDAVQLNISVALYVLVTALAYVFGRMQYLYLNRTGEAFLRELRLKVFAAMQRQSMAFYDRNKSGVLVARMTADIETMAELVQWGLLQFLASAFLVVLAFAVLFALSWQLTLVVLIVFPILVVASIKFQRDSNTAYLTVRERVGQNLSTLQEGIGAVRVIQAYAQEDKQIERFRISNRSLFNSHLRSIRISTWYFGLVEFSGVAATALIVGIGGWLVHRDTVSLGTVVAFVLLLSSLFDPVQQLSQLYNSVQSSAAALHKLFAILDATPEVNEVAGAVELPERGNLVVRNVTFKYQSGETNALDDVSISVRNGERLALVGPTGAGKSTLAKLMARLYDPSSGEVSYGGVDLRRTTMASLRERIVVVPQEGFLFNGTIRDNVRIARVTATDAQVDAALESLGILERFLQLPDGLETQVRERGGRLSAGERQLVALGRAALVDPAVLVLDEATSNLDPGTEAEVEHALERLMSGRTTIVVAHRLTTVQRADRIAVINNARIVELGTHLELIALSGHYAVLARAWEKSHAI